MRDGRAWGIFPGGTSPWAYLAYVHRNLASRPQACLGDSSEGPFLPVVSIQQMTTIIMTVVMIMYRAKLSNYISGVYLVKSSSEAGLWDKIISPSPMAP